MNRLKTWLTGAVIGVAVIASAVAPVAAARNLDEIMASKKLIVGINPTLPPLGVFNDKNQIDGVDVDIAKAIADKLGLTLEIVQVGSPDRIPFVGSEVQQPVHASGVALVARRQDREALCLEQFGRFGGLKTLQECQRILVFGIGRLGNRIDDRRMRILREGADHLDALLGMRVGGVDDAERRFPGRDQLERWRVHAG